jgi:hypothetical protein
MTSAMDQSRRFGPLPVTCGQPYQRTWSDHLGMSVSCHEETHAPQQTATLFDHFVIEMSVNQFGARARERVRATKFRITAERVSLRTARLIAVRGDSPFIGT